MRVKFQYGQSSGAIAMNPYDILTFCIKIFNIFENNSALERRMKKKLRMECLGDKCHLCAFSDAQKPQEV